VFGVVPRQPAGLRLGVYLETHRGRVEIHQLAPGSLAERSGLRAGDVITGIDGSPATSARQVIDAVTHHPRGRPLSLSVQREGRTLELRLPLPGAAGR
jgi:S1-C subfamily serine protease